MKKTLLFFLLLFTNYFYAQVSNMEHCAGNNTFDLTLQKPLLIGNLNPAETTVSYHISLADANNNLNPIVNPANFVETGNVPTIYARIDNKGSITTNYFNLIVNPVLVANASVVYVNCVPRIVISGSGGNSNYEYSHAGVTFTQNNIVNNPSPGSQTVYIRDGNGCVASKSLIVDSLSPLSWRAQTKGVTCPESNDGTVEVTAVGGKAPYLFSIGNEFASSNIFRNLKAGDHTVTIKDATGCTISFNFTIRAINPVIAISTVITNDSNAANEGKIDLSVSGGVPPYMYALKDDKGIIIPSKTTNPFTGLAVGSYEVIVTDTQGCTLSQKGINILNAPTPLTTTAAVTAITCVITTGSITVTPHGGVLPYQYSIDNGNTYGNSNVFSGLVAGTYNIKVRDAQNSVVDAISTIDPIKMPEITITYKDVLCHGDSNGSILVGASNGKSPNLFSINGGEYISYNLFENLPAGNYVLSVKDSNGCIVSGSVTLKDPALITAEIIISDKSVVINASGGYGKYEYALDGGTYKDANVFSNVSYGNHTIYVRDPNKCILIQTITVIKPIPVLSSVIVNKGTLTITATGGTLPYTYSLQDISGYPTYKTQASNIFTDVVNGTYKTIVTDSKGATYVQADIIISQSSVLTAISTATSITCRDLKGTITVTATGGKSPYQYSLDFGNSYTTSNILPNLNAGSYTITVKDSNNFKTTSFITVNVAQPLLVTAEIVSNLSCYGSNDGVIRVTTIQGQAPYTYVLDNTNSQSTSTFTNLSAGIHTIQVTDKNNCTAVVTVTITEPKPLKSTVVVNDKTITAHSTDGTAPYIYYLQKNNQIISGPQTSDTFTNLPVGIYSLQIVDAKGCSLLRDNINITDSPVIVATTNITPITCVNPTGALTIIASGGSGSYQYSIDNGVSYSASNTFSNLSAGNYIINVKDSQNNTTSISTSIIPYIPLTSIAVVTKTIDCVSNATITVNASGGKRPYQYSLDNGASYTSINTFTNINAGTYFVRVKDSLDCTVITNNITLEQPVPLTATAASTKIADCSINYNSTITITANGGQAPYVYAVNSSTNYQTSNVYFGAAPGTHIVNVKDANGCVFTTALVIESPSLLTLTATITDAAICGGKSSATINATGGQAPYTYSFTGGSTYSPVNTNELSPGGYTLFVKDSYGCIATIYVTIQSASVPVSTIWTVTNATSPNNNDGSITVLASGGTAPYTYSLLNGNNVTIIPAQLSNTFSNLATGIYSILVTDAKGCSSPLKVATISSPPTLLAIATVTQPSCDNPIAVITINATGGTVPYQYSIDNGVTYNVTDTFIVTQPGNYILTVRDAQNVIYTQNVVVMPLNPIFVNATVVSNVTCVSNGIIAVNVTGGLAPYSYSLNGGVFQNTNVFTELSPGNYIITAKDINGCTQVVSVDLNAPTAIVAAVTVDNQKIVVHATGGNGNYQYSLDGSSFQSSPIFTNISYGIHDVFVRDQNGCTVSIIVAVDPPAPLIDGKDIITIEFKAGQTLGDLVIDGQNIKWYSNQNPLGGKTTKSSEVTLPLTTLLVDGTTYYASQTINGIESIERLAVTAKLNGSLSTPDVVLPNFSYYPNPVQHTLIVDNASTIDEIEIVSVSGKSILTKKINSNHSEIDLSNVASGFYLLKVKSEGQTKTIKIVKK
ncbi:T9SS type A sorting domain-containing protein [Flavobacterium sp. FlaQc-47]|uniref:T9SS type A sorting domain-containing protein n=1 Tax=Flavobacterium sp. FlaQc-47 TaxID=3374180 RepID=UPI003757D6B1